MDLIIKFFREYWHHLKWHILVYPSLFAGSILFGIVFEGRGIQESLLLMWGYVVSHPILIALPVFAVTLYRFIKSTYVFFKRNWLRLLQLEQMAKDVGIRSFSHNNINQKDTNWSTCKNELKKTPSQLNSMGSGGYETFSSPASPLYDYLRSATCDIRILLLNPESDAFKQRCASTRSSEDEYRNWIYASIEYCRDLKTKRNSSLEIRLYSDYPIWKMIYTEEYMWLQWYKPDVDIHSTQVYHLQSTAGSSQTSLYYPLTSVFRRRWNLGKRIDLDKWHRPK